MIISYGTDETKNPDSVKLADLVTSLNTAIGNRMATSGSISNVGTTPLFGKQARQYPLNDQPSNLNFTTLSFFFKDSKDPAGLTPLQGIAGLTDKGATLALGTQKPDQVFDLDFTGFSQISELTTFYAQTTEESQKQRYGHRIVAFYFAGKNASGGAGNKLVMPPDMGRLGTITDLASLRAAVKDFNRNNAYQILEDTRPLNLTFTLAAQPGKRLTVLNAGASFFKGASCYYIDSLSLSTALPAGTVSFDTSQVTAVKFALDFELVDWGQNPPSDCGSYEVSFQATRGRRNLEISQSGSSHSLKIPISSVEYTFGYTESESKQRERTAQNQLAEKLSIKLPPTYYRLIDFTGTALSDVAATIQVVAGTSVSNVIVPLGKKILPCATPGAAVNTIIGSI